MISSSTLGNLVSQMLAQNICELTVDCDGHPTHITIAKASNPAPAEPGFRRTYNRLRLLDTENSQQPHLN